MRSVKEFRSGKPGFYPDQSIYAEFACAEFGLAFRGYRWRHGTGFQRRLASKTLHFGAGRCSWYPQNNATAVDAGVGQIFHQRHPGSAPACRRWAANISSCMTGTAPIARRDMSATTRWNISEAGRNGLRQAAARDRAAISRKPFMTKPSLLRYLAEVARYYDAILIQPLVCGNRIPDFPARRRSALYRAQISAFCPRRWRAPDPRSADRA